MTIGGKAVLTKKRQAVPNPSTGGIVGTMSQASRKDAEAAVAAAKKAFASWKSVLDADRQAACMAVAAKIEEHAEELAKLLTQEQGKPLGGLGSRWWRPRLDTPYGGPQSASGDFAGHARGQG
jgi:acyl-CoA reductase-like NAD-dependent aldehyde dehydrogenase